MRRGSLERSLEKRLVQEMQSPKGAPSYSRGAREKTTGMGNHQGRKVAKQTYNQSLPYGKKAEDTFNAMFNFEALVKDEEETVTKEDDAEMEDPDKKTTPKKDVVIKSKAKTPEEIQLLEQEIRKSELAITQVKEWGRSTGELEKKLEKQLEELKQAQEPDKITVGDVTKMIDMLKQAAKEAEEAFEKEEKAIAEKQEALNKQRGELKKKRENQQAYHAEKQKFCDQKLADLAQGNQVIQQAIAATKQAEVPHVLNTMNPREVVAHLKQRGESEALSEYYVAQVEALKDMGKCMESFAGREKLEESLEGLVQAWKTEKGLGGVTRSAPEDNPEAQKVANFGPIGKGKGKSPEQLTVPE